MISLPAHKLRELKTHRFAKAAAEEALIVAHPNTIASLQEVIDLEEYFPNGIEECSFVEEGYLYALSHEYSPPPLTPFSI
jgi:hypothetical protein